MKSERILEQEHKPPKVKWDKKGLFSSREIMVFTDKHNCYFLRSQSFASFEQILRMISLEPGEHAIYITPTRNYKGFLITAYENGKVAKVSMAAFQAKTKRTKLGNAYYDKARLNFIAHFDTDVDLIVMSTIRKVVLFNTSAINVKSTRSIMGVQVLEQKDGSKLWRTLMPDTVEFEDLEYYRKESLPAVGYYLKEGDHLQAPVRENETDERESE